MHPSCSEVLKLRRHPISCSIIWHIACHQSIICRYGNNSEPIPLNLFYNFPPWNKVVYHTALLSHNRFDPEPDASQIQEKMKSRALFPSPNFRTFCRQSVLYYQSQLRIRIPSYTLCIDTRKLAFQISCRNSYLSSHGDGSIVSQSGI